MQVLQYLYYLGLSALIQCVLSHCDKDACTINLDHFDNATPWGMSSRRLRNCFIPQPIVDLKITKERYNKTKKKTKYEGKKKKYKEQKRIEKRFFFLSFFVWFLFLFCFGLTIKENDLDQLTQVTHRCNVKRVFNYYRS